MSKPNYTRRSRGGKFKRLEAGQQGVSAYKAQQDQIINALKQNRLRQNEYSKEYASGLARVYEAQERNRRTLASLEDEAFDNRVDAIKVRQRREYEALQGKATEYGKQKEYWEKFSSTYAKEWGKLAQGTWNLKDRLEADDNWQQMIASPGLMDKIVNINLKSDQYQQRADFYREILNEQTTAANSGDEDAADKIKYLNNAQVHRLNRLRFVNDIKTQLPSILEDLKQKAILPVEEGGLGFKEITKDNVREIFNARYREIIRQSNLPIASKEAAELRQAFNKAGALEYKTLKLNHQIRTTQENLKISVKQFEAEKTPENLLKIYTSITGGIFKDSNGGILKPKGLDAIKTAVKEIASSFSSDEEALEFIYNSPVPGAILEEDGNYSETLKQRFDTKYKGTEKGEAAKQAFEEDISNIISKSLDNEAKINELDRKKLAAQEIIKLENKPSGYFSTPQGIDEGISLLNSYSKKYSGIQGDKNPAVRLRSLIGNVAPNSYLTSDIEKRYVKAVAEGDYLEAAETYRQLDSTLQKTYANQNTYIKKLSDIGDELYKSADAALRQKSQLNTVTDQLSQSGRRLIGTKSSPGLAVIKLRSDFIRLAQQEEYKDASSNRILDDALKLFNKDLDNNVGILESLDPAQLDAPDLIKKYGITKGNINTGKRIFLRGLNREIPGEHEKVKVNEYEMNETFFNTFKDEDGNLVQLMSKYDTQTLSESLLIEGTINSKDPAYENLRNIADKNPKETFSQVVNKWLKINGYSERMQPEYHDMAKDKAVALKLNIPNLDTLKEEAAIAAVETEFIKQTEEPGAVLHLVNPRVRELYIRIMLEREKNGGN